MKFLVESLAFSERWDCVVVGLSRSSFRYVSRRRELPGLRERLRALAQERPRFGYERRHLLLRREGAGVNHKQILRLYREENLELPRRGRRRRGRACLRTPPSLLRRTNQRWSMDFMADSLFDGHRFRTFNLVDDFTRECPAIEVDFSIPAARVVRVLDRVAIERGYPEVIVVANGPEFASRDLDLWAHAHGPRLHFIRPGKPVENAYIESFNGKVRDECLERNLFLDLADAHRSGEAWRRDYNDFRPHTSLGGLTPVELARLQATPVPTNRPGRTPRPGATRRLASCARISRRLPDSTFAAHGTDPASRP